MLIPNTDIGQLGQPFQKAADGVLDRLYDCVTTMPVFVKINDAVPLDGALLNRIIKAIREKKRVGFQYTAGQGGGAHPVNLEPYRVVYFPMGQYEAIRNILKSRIPNIVILEPEEFKKDLLEDVRR